MRYMSNGNDVLQPLTGLTAKEILVFATSIRTGRDLKQVKAIMKDISGVINWNVDMEDWEKVLRIEGVGVPPSLIISLISRNGFFIKELE